MKKYTDRTIKTVVRAATVIAIVLLLFSCSSGDSEKSEASNESRGAYSMPVGGIESITVDGTDYYFGYSHIEDRVITRLFSSADEISDYAAKAMSQRDGMHDKAYWLAQANANHLDSELTDREGQTISLTKLNDALLRLKQDSDLNQTIPSLVIPSHLGYLLEMNCNWPDEEPPLEIQTIAVRLGLEADDRSPWLDESAAILSGRSPLPKGASFNDARTLFLWYWKILVENQDHDWNSQLGFI